MNTSHIAEKYKEEINEIKEKHNFKNDFDLAKILSELPTNTRLHRMMVQSFPRASIKKKNLKRLIKASDNLIKELRNAKAQTKIEIDDADAFGEEDNDHRLKREREGWDINQFAEDLIIFHQLCLYTDASIEKDAGGRNPDSLPRYVILGLASIYERGTGAEPTCGWSDLDGFYVGAFYEFLCELTPILDELGLELGTEQSIGKYATEAIHRYKEIVEKLKSDEKILQDLQLQTV